MPIDAASTDELRRWIGRSASQHDVVTPTPIAALAATLDRDESAPVPGDMLPPLWHWLYFLPIHRLSSSGPDGHPARGDFLPPVSLPRRMWGGGRLEFQRPIRVGEAISRISRIRDVTVKTGRSGPLVFVTVRHEISAANLVAVTEEHDIVYRGNPGPGDAASAPNAAPGEPTWMRTIDPDPVLLFRYSALTLNSHRIHYDRQYATGVEGYPGLVVHGPLVATLLVDLLRRNLPRASMTHFSYRAAKPLFDTAPFSVCGRVGNNPGTLRLWAETPQHEVAMEATATLA